MMKLTDYLKVVGKGPRNIVTQQIGNDSHHFKHADSMLITALHTSGLNVHGPDEKQIVKT